MSDKSKALRLADELVETPFQSTRHIAAAELRRLHEVNQELLEALEQMVSVFLDTEGSHGDAENEAMGAAHAAIAKATGEKA